MMQLVQNPVFMANPSCLGDFLHNLVKTQHGESPVPSPQDPGKQPAENGSDSGKRPLENANGLKSGGDQNVEAYRCFWSKFKRPAEGCPTGPGEEGRVETTPIGDGSAAEVAVQPVVAKSDEAVAPIAPAASESEIPDPVGPAQPHAKVEASPSSGDATGAEKDLEIMLSPGDGDDKVSIADVRGDGDDKVPIEDVSKQLKFTPQAADVHACLQRKTTLDMAKTMAPCDMPGHTAVVMDLAGVLQDVWIPMTPEAAVKAGLTLSPSVRTVTPTSSMVSTASSKGAATASPHAEAALDLKIDAAGNVQVRPSASGEPATAAPPVATPASVPAAPMVEAPTPGTSETPTPETSHALVPAPAGAVEHPPSERTSTADDADAQAKAALRNSYMRFHRSVTSNLTKQNIFSYCNDRYL